MKKLILLIIFILTNFLSYAQETSAKKRIIVGGAIGFVTQENNYPLTGASWSFFSKYAGSRASSRNDNAKNSYFSIEPYVAKEINQHWLVGIQSSLKVRRYKAFNSYSYQVHDTINYSIKSNELGIAFFGRRTFFPEQRFNFFLQSRVKYGISKRNIFYDDKTAREGELHILEIGIDAGAQYDVNEKWRIIIRFGGASFVTGKWEDYDNIDETTESNKFNALGLSFRTDGVRFGVERKF